MCYAVMIFFVKKPYFFCSSNRSPTLLPFQFTMLKIGLSQFLSLSLTESQLLCPVDSLKMLRHRWPGVNLVGGERKPWVIHARENVWCALKKYLKNQKTCFAAWHFQSRLLCIHVCKDCCWTIKSTFPPGIEIRWKARYTCVKIKMWYGLVHNILVHNRHTYALWAKYQITT